MVSGFGLSISTTLPVWIAWHNILLSYYMLDKTAEPSVSASSEIINPDIA